MPHLQASSSETKVSTTGGKRGLTEGSAFGGGKIPTSENPMAPSASASDDLPIQEATKGYLGTSDPVVAMANKGEKAEKVSFDDSVEGGTTSTASSPTARSRISKSLVTPSPLASQSRLPARAASNAEKDAEKETSPVLEGAPPILTIYGDSRLSHSPIRVKRHVSHSEDDEMVDATANKMNSETATYLRYGGVEAVSRPVLIRRGSSMGKRSASDDSEDSSDAVAFKKVKVDTTSYSEHFNLESSVEEAAAAMAGMRQKPVISSSSSGEKLDHHYPKTSTRPPMPGYHERPASQYYPHYSHASHQAPYHYPSYSHPSYGYGQGVHSMYHGYPPHTGASTHTGLASSHHDYYPHYAVPPQSGMHAYRPPPPYAPALDHPTKQVTKSTSSRNSKNTNEKAGSPSNGNIGRESFPSVSSPEWQQGLPVSSKRCVPLRDPVCNKARGRDDDETKEASLPDFHRVVNFPDFLTKARNEAHCPTGKKNCVMCGKLRICSANSGRHGNAAMLKVHMGGDSEDTSHIIPRQNKGLCTACDVSVWVLVSQNLEIKWCKGCKNFRPWAAFGDKGSATKCVRCRERQREKYALQRDEMRSRRSQRGSSASPSDSDSSGGKEDHQMPMTAAEGLRSLLNAASTVYS